MSKENVKLFIEKVEQDESLQEKVKGVIGENQEVMVENLINLAHKYGYDFSKEDMEQLAKEISVDLQEKGELDESQLEAVSGGVGVTAVVTVVLLGGLAVTVVGGVGFGLASRVEGNECFYKSNS